jgi:hypothetical protein
MEKGAGRSTWRVLPWHEKGSEYLQGTAKELEMVMCDWPGLMNGDGHVWLTWFMKRKGVSPFLEILLNLFYKRF